MSVLMQSLVRRLHYTEWGNQRSLDTLMKLQSGSSEQLAKGQSIIGHAILSQMCWYDRVLQRPMRRNFWEEVPLDELQMLNRASIQEWLGLLEEKKESYLATGIPYVNSRGESYNSTVEEILTHVINHSTHHRGQVNFLIRQGGVEPPLTDFIIFARGR